MTYAGEIHNGVVVLRDAPPLREGTPVRVEVNLENSQYRRGSQEAVLEAMSHISGSWTDSEIDAALDDLRRSKWEEVRLQQASPEPEL